MKPDAKIPLMTLLQWGPSAFQEKQSSAALPSTSPGHAKLLSLLTAQTWARFTLHLKTHSLIWQTVPFNISSGAIPRSYEHFLRFPSLFISWTHLVLVSHSTFSSHFVTILNSFSASILLHIFPFMSDRLFPQFFYQKLLIFQSPA